MLGDQMSHRIEVKKGQSFQDGTGLTVRVAEIDGSDRVHFSVSGDREASCAAPGEMSTLAFVRRFTRIDTVELLTLDSQTPRDIAEMLDPGKSGKPGESETPHGRGRSFVQPLR
jgi:hypothetical protein